MPERLKGFLKVVGAIMVMVLASWLVMHFLFSGGERSWKDGYEEGFKQGYEQALDDYGIDRYEDRKAN